MTDSILYPCVSCKKDVINDAIECSLCNKWCHIKCSKLSKKRFEFLSREGEYWYCVSCIKLFPFHTVTDEEFILLDADSDNSYEYLELLSKCRDIKRDRELYCEHNRCDFDKNLDPNNNFLSEFDNTCGKLCI